MPTGIFELTELATVPVLADVLVIVDTTDNTQAPQGSAKKVTVATLFSNPTISGTATVVGGTVTTSTPILTATETWNAGAVTFEAIVLNVTDTSSAAASLLLNLKVGGVSQAKVTKAGTLTLTGALNVASDAVVGASTGSHSVTINGIASTGNAYVAFQSTASNKWYAGRGPADNSDNFQIYDVAGARAAITVTTSTSAVAIATTLNVVSDFSVATNKFTVLAASGNTACAGTLTHGDTLLIRTSATLGNNAGAFTGTLTNAPTVGNPTKWVAINDNGTTRYIPTWT